MTTSESQKQQYIKRRIQKLRENKKVKLYIIPGLDNKSSWMQHMYHLQDGIFYEKRCGICNMRDFTKDKNMIEDN